VGLNCEQPVLASGLDVTLHEDVLVECTHSGDGVYECDCPLVNWFTVNAGDAASACETAVSICVGD
jgi:hypothetical protein